MKKLSEKLLMAVVNNTDQFKEYLESVKDLELKSVEDQPACVVIDEDGKRVFEGHRTDKILTLAGSEEAIEKVAIKKYFQAKKVVKATIADCCLTIREEKDDPDMVEAVLLRTEEKLDRFLEDQPELKEAVDTSFALFGENIKPKHIDSSTCFYEMELATEKLNIGCDIYDGGFDQKGFSSLWAVLTDKQREATLLGEKQNQGLKQDIMEESIERLCNELLQSYDEPSDISKDYWETKKAVKKAVAKYQENPTEESFFKVNDILDELCKDEPELKRAVCLSMICSGDVTVESVDYGACLYELRQLIKQLRLEYCLYYNEMDGDTELSTLWLSMTDEQKEAVLS